MKNQSAKNLNREDILGFIKNQKLATVATVDSENNAQAAVVEFGELPDMTIVIDCLKSSRKYKNWQTNKSAAVVIGWEDDITVQINGIARQLKGNDLEKAKEVYFSKNSRAKKWAHNPDIAYFAIKPTRVRYSDVSKRPWLIKEFKL